MTTEGVKATEKSKEEAVPVQKVAKVAVPAQVPLPPDEIVVPGVAGDKVVYVKTLDGKYKTYPTLADAIKYSRDESVLRVKRSITETLVVEGGRTITIDLEGNTWTSDATPLTVFGAEVTVRNGSITASNVPAIVVGKDNTEANPITVRSYVNLVDLDPNDNEKHISVQSTGHDAIEIRSGGILTTQAFIESDNQAAIATPVGKESTNFGAECFILGGSVVTNSASHAIDWHQGDLRISGGVITSKDVDAIEFDAGNLDISDVSIDAGTATAININQMNKPVSVNISGGVFDGDTGCITQASNVEGKGLRIFINGGEFKTTGTVFTAPDVKNFVSGTSVRFTREVAAEFIDPKYVIKGSDVNWYLIYNDWVTADSGAVGGGFIGYQRLLIRKSEIAYATGGITVPLQGLYPAMIVSVTAKGGLTAWYDRENNKFVLYRGGVEVPNTAKLEDFAMLLIGN